MKELRVAIIGGGGFMGKAHSLAYAVAPLAAELGVIVRKEVLVDATPELAEHSARQLGWASSSSDWREVVARPEIDIVDIVTPPGLHEEIAIAAARAGKHVFCEKPITNDSVSAEAMARAVEGAGVVGQVGFNYRHTPAVAFAKQIIDRGDLGAPLSFRASYLQEVGFFSDPSRWRAHKSTGGSGTVGDIGSHVIDVAQLLFGDIVSVSARMRSLSPTAPYGWLPESDRLARDLIDDAGTWMAQFENGAIGTFAVSSFASGRKNRLAFEADGSRGALDFDWNTREQLRVSYVDDPLDHQGFRTVHAGAAHPDAWWKIAGLGSGYVEVAGIQIQSFLRAIVTGSAGQPDFARAAQVQRVVEAVEASAATARWVDVAGPGSDRVEEETLNE